MKRNFDEVVKDYDGHAKVRVMNKYDDAGMPVHKDGAPEFSHYQPMTLRLYALDALHGRWRGEEGLDHKESRKRMDLADRIAFSTDGEVELTTDDTVMILTALKNQGREHLVVGRMTKLFDTDPAPTT